MSIHHPCWPCILKKCQPSGEHIFVHILATWIIHLHKSNDYLFFRILIYTERWRNLIFERTIYNHMKAWAIFFLLYNIKGFAYVILPIYICCSWWHKWWRKVVRKLEYFQFWILEALSKFTAHINLTSSYQFEFPINCCLWLRVLKVRFRRKIAEAHLVLVHHQ